MQRGQFLRIFFEKRETLTPNARGEIPVRCPFPHDKGYEVNPSAHINLSKGVFHCKTCRAEDRFNEGGLSEIGFVSELYSLSYEEALEAMTQFSFDEDNDFSVWDRCEAALTKTHFEMYLRRGIRPEAIRQHRIGYRGDGLAYPVTLYGVLCDIRTYDPTGKPKMRSRKGASPLLFPFDLWLDDPRPTLLVGGENDAIIARQEGFNALSVTGGEGSFPDILITAFKGRTVYICYDCDEAGRNGAVSVAYKLKEAGATVYIVNLGLPGTKDDKDITDFFVKHGKTAADVQALMDQAKPYTEEDYRQDKEERYPAVDLWRVPEGRYAGRRISSRVIISGVYDQPMHVPSAVEWECRGAEECTACERCPLNSRDGNRASGWWTLGDKNLDDTLRLVEVNEGTQAKTLQGLIGMPKECPNGGWEIRAKQVVYKVVFTPDVETENDLEGFRASEQYAYMLGITPEDGARSRVYFKPFAHPRDGQRVFAIVDKIEPSDNAVSTFKMTPEIRDSLKVFEGHPNDVMKDRVDRAKSVVGTFAPEMVIYATDLMYHSPMAFKYNGRQIKGYPEGLVVGESRTGKSDTVKGLQFYYGLGNYTAVKGATTASLMGGADKLPNGGHKVTWGIVPRNHKGLVFFDEMSGMPREVMASLTDMRSSGIASVVKIARGKAPAQTRILWASNPRTENNQQSRALYDYSSGVQVVLDLVGSDEDIARFDFIMLIPAPSELSSPLEEADKPAYGRELYRSLIYWVWSRTADQVKWDEGVEAYVWQRSQELNEKYNTDVKFFGAEAWKKLARIAVACAGACFSHTSDAESILVRKSHVDWAADFLVKCYDNPIFRLREYAAERRMYNETNELVNTVVAKHCNKNPMLVRALLNSSTSLNKFNLQAVSGLDNQPFNEAIADLSKHYLIQITNNAFSATRRLRKAVDVYREDYKNQRMIPLSEGGSAGV